MAALRHLQATVEDYHSDAGEAVLESFRCSPTANVAAKRSNPESLRTEKPSSQPAPAARPVLVATDVSDSEYGSTVVTMSSTADSVPSARSPPTAPSSAGSLPPPSPATTKKRPDVLPERRQHGSSQDGAPRKPLQRTGSVASRRPPPGARRPTQSEVVVDCDKPNCTKCQPQPQPQQQQQQQQQQRQPPVARPSRSNSRRPESQNFDYPAYDQVSHRSDPVASHTSPPSPMYARQPGLYAQGTAMVMPAHTRRRSSVSQRPMSYHGEAGAGYWPPGMLPSPPQEYGPPPAMSTRYNMPPHPMQQQQQPPPNPFMQPAPPAGYFPGHPAGHPMGQTSPPYEQPRPPPSARGAPPYATRPQARQTSSYGPPLVTQQDMPSARYHNAPNSARQEHFPASQFEESSESDTDEDEDDFALREDYLRQELLRQEQALMLPPKLKGVMKPTKDLRPALRHAQTTSVYNESRDRRQSMSQTPQPLDRPSREREARPPRKSNAAASGRAPSSTRPALIQPKAQSSYDTPRPTQAMVEHPKSRRRQSYQVYDKEFDREYAAEQKRRNRDSKIYREEYEDAVVAPEPRRRTDTVTSRREGYMADPKERRTAQDAEAYQQRTRGAHDPLADSVHKAAKRASRVPSDAATSRSEDRKTRVSQSARTNVTNGTGGGGDIRLRVDTAMPLSVSFEGGIEGRTLQLIPAEGGMADIYIGSSARDSESVYHSNRASVQGDRRTLVPVGSARREAEESSVRSARSSQARRGDSERRPSRRSHQDDYL